MSMSLFKILSMHMSRFHGNNFIRESNDYVVALRSADDFLSLLKVNIVTLPGFFCDLLIKVVLKSVQ